MYVPNKIKFRLLTTNNYVGCQLVVLAIIGKNYYNIVSRLQDYTPRVGCGGVG